MGPTLILKERGKLTEKNIIGKVEKGALNFSPTTRSSKIWKVKRKRGGREEKK